MGMPIFIDEVAFASNPFDTPQVYTDLSARTRVRGFSRGRQKETLAPDKGQSSTTFENSDRALDPENAASTYYPNVIPMRRTRCRVVDAVPVDAGPLTVSGNEITDIVRNALVQGDGRTAPDSSFGIWEATTNLCKNGGFETNLTGWAQGGAGVVTRTRDTTQAKFGAASQKVACDGSSGNQGAKYDDGGTRIAASAGQVWAASGWIRGNAGGETGCYVSIEWFDGSSVSLGSATGSALTLTSGWQKYLVIATAPTNTASFQVRYQQTPATAQTWFIDGCQAEQKSLTTPYVHTDGSTAARTAARVQAPASRLDETQGWVVARLRMAYVGGSSPPVTSPGAFAFGDDTNNRLILYVPSSGKWNFYRIGGGAGGAAAVSNVTWAAGDVITVVAHWTATQVKISVNGEAFVAANQSTIPALAASLFDIGSIISGGGTTFDGDVLWFACGTGTLSTADAATINAMGSTAADASDLFWPVAADPSMVWQADTATYRVPDDAFLFTNFIDTEQGWVQNQLGPGQAEAVVPGNDGFDVLSTHELTASQTYPLQAAGLRIAAILDTAGWPAAERAIDTTSQQSDVQAANAGDLTGVSALDAIQAAAANDNGIFFIDGRGYAVFMGRHRQADPRYTTSQATFCDAPNYTAGRLLYKSLKPSTSRIRNDYRVTRKGGTEQPAEDSTSIGKYRRRTETVSTLHATDAEALNYAQYRVLLDKDPYRRYDELVVTPLDDANMWVALLSLRLGDRITVFQTPPGGGAAVQRDLLIEAMSVTVGPGPASEWRFRLSPISNLVGWVIGDAVYGLLGSTTVLTY